MKGLLRRYCVMPRYSLFPRSAGRLESFVNYPGYARSQDSKRRRPSSMRSWEVAKEKRTQESMPKPSPGTAATWASSRRRRELDGASDVLSRIEGLDSRKHVEGAFRLHALDSGKN